MASFSKALKYQGRTGLVIDLSLTLHSSLSWERRAFHQS